MADGDIYGVGGLIGRDDGLLNILRYLSVQVEISIKSALMQKPEVVEPIFLMASR
jgi:hypothetical protein